MRKGTAAYTVAAAIAGTTAYGANLRSSSAQKAKSEKAVATKETPKPEKSQKTTAHVGVREPSSPPENIGGIGAVALGVTTAVAVLRGRRRVPASPRYPVGETVRVVGHTPTESGGLIYEARGADNVGFERGKFAPMVRMFPHFAARFRFEAEQTPTGELVTRYPDVIELNAIVNSLAGTDYPSFIRYYSFPQGVVPPLQFIERWAGREVPIAQRGREHFHDLMVHWIYLVLPKKVVDTSAGRAQTVTDLAHSKILMKNKFIRDYVGRLAEEMADCIDDKTALMADRVVKPDSNNPDLHVSVYEDLRIDMRRLVHVSDGDTVVPRSLGSGKEVVEHLRIRLDYGKIRLTESERRELQRIDDKASDLQILDDEIPGLVDEMMHRLRGSEQRNPVLSDLPIVEQKDFPTVEAEALGRGSEVNVYPLPDNRVLMIGKFADSKRSGISLSPERYAKKEEEEELGLKERIETVLRLHHLQYEGHNVAVKIYSVVKSPEGRVIGYIAERVEGETLDTFTKRKESLSQEQLTEAKRQLSEQLALIHQAGVVIGDVNPDNILIAVGPRGEITARLVDFNAPGFSSAPTHLSPESDRDRLDWWFNIASEAILGIAFDRRKFRAEVAAKVKGVADGRAPNPEEAQVAAPLSIDNSGGSFIRPSQLPLVKARRGVQERLMLDIPFSPDASLDLNDLGIRVFRRRGLDGTQEIVIRNLAVSSQESSKPRNPTVFVANGREVRLYPTENNSSPPISPANGQRFEYVIGGSFQQDVLIHIGGYSFYIPSPSNPA